MNNKNKKKKIIFAGGGTAGSVAPLLGILEELQRQQKEYNYLWLGTKNGVEEQMVLAEKIAFRPIISAKFRRYFSLRNIVDGFKLKLAFWQSYFILLREKPCLVICAGSYVGVPVVWAAWLLGIPVLIHQQDVRPGLANRLMALFARTVTVTFARSLDDYGKKAIWVGNSIRREFKDIKITPREACQKFGLVSSLKVVLIIGGGTGAKAINDLVDNSLVELTKFCQVLHIVGKGKMSELAREHQMSNPNYRVFEFLDSFGIIKAYSAASIVVSRCGMATLTELAFLGKPSILIPMPGSHQEDNARIFAAANAAIVLEQKDLDVNVFIGNIRELLNNEVLQRNFSNEIQSIIKPDGNLLITEQIEKLIT
ncbi:UDP-N-acetylglucosamine--N-acetylmuramyl-(pentapeptide) pyrophosphoryl-undecaprenol N-acetylglucosamine transferase [Candidatus Parcubacteria bacterium]|nr:UDP-N-acetylglucosamine--N-acetylmuramyl-(pentapeptide) pyrophosphoryl-undecaprenol N-acetylglucosamine transferase [Candidatus Parcubacteria bacterium]